MIFLTLNIVKAVRFDMQINSIPYSRSCPSHPFKDIAGNDLPLLSCIFPILKVYGECEMNTIGTGFFISFKGLFVTAAHVIHEWLEKDGTIQSKLIGAHFDPITKNFTLRGIEGVYLHEKSDIAVGIMKQTSFDEESIIYNQYLPISLYLPYNREIVKSISLPQTIASTPLPLRRHPYFKPQGIHSGGNAGPVILPMPLESAGRITKFYPRGRDRVFLPGPCYEAELQVYGGSSGGPVIDMRGAIIGVTNTGFAEFPISHFTPVSEILDIKFHNTINGNNGKELTIDWLIENNYIEIQ